MSVAEVVTLCGSMRVFPLMLQVAAAETAAGRIVLAPFSVVAPADQGSEFKAMLDELHRRKIDMADRVIVVTGPSGYYGASTEGEIEYAKQTGKPVEMRSLADGLIKEWGTAVAGEDPNEQDSSTVVADDRGDAETWAEASGTQVIWRYVTCGAWQVHP